MRLQIAFLFPKFTKEQEKEKEMLEMKLKQLDQEQQQAPPPKKSIRESRLAAILGCKDLRHRRIEGMKPVS
jgi:hypothetical protein